MASHMNADPDYREFHLNQLRLGAALPEFRSVSTIAQLGGCNIEQMVNAARSVQPYVQGIGCVASLCEPALC